MRTILCSLAWAVASLGAAGAETDAPVGDELRSATFRGVFPESVSLTDGRWEGAPFVPDGAARPVVLLFRDFRMVGELDGFSGDEAVVLLAASGGGSGSDIYIAVVGRDGDEIVNFGTALLGDWVQVRDGRIGDGRIEIDVVQAGAGDAACCPTQLATRSFRLAAGELVEGEAEVTGELTLATLGGVEWVLTHLGAHEPVPAKPRITLWFDDDRVHGAGGCNSYFSDLTSGAAGELTLGPIGATKMACPAKLMKLEALYLGSLQGASGIGFHAGRLAVSYQRGESFGVLLFTRARAAISLNY